jgi:hypothetical protein
MKRIVVLLILLAIIKQNYAQDNADDCINLPYLHKLGDLNQVALFSDSLIMKVPTSWTIKNALHFDQSDYVEFTTIPNTRNQIDFISLSIYTIQLGSADSLLNRILRSKTTVILNHCKFNKEATCYFIASFQNAKRKNNVCIHLFLDFDGYTLNFSICGLIKSRNYKKYIKYLSIIETIYYRGKKIW